MTQALILKGERDRQAWPLLDGTERQEVSLCGVPIEVRVKDVLRGCGIGQFVIIQGISAVDNIEAYFDGSQDLIVVSGDIVFEPRILQALMKAQSALNVLVDIRWRKYWEVRRVDPLHNAETLKLDRNRFLTELGQVPEDSNEIQAQLIGLFKVRADFVRSFFELYQTLACEVGLECDRGKRLSANSYLQWLIDAGWEILAVPVMHGWLKIDRQADLDLYERLQLSGDLAEFCKLD